MSWRGYFAYVSPSTIQLPNELQDMLPDGVTVIMANLGVRAHQGAEFARAAQGPDPAALARATRETELAQQPLVRAMLAIRRG